MMFKSRTYHGYRHGLSRFIGKVEREILRPDGQMEMQALKVPEVGSPTRRYSCNTFDWGLGKCLGPDPMMGQDPQGTLAVAILSDCFVGPNKYLMIKSIYKGFRDKIIILLPRDEFFLSTLEMEMALEEDIVLAGLDMLASTPSHKFGPIWLGKATT